MALSEMISKLDLGQTTAIFFNKKGGYDFVKYI